MKFSIQLEVSDAPAATGGVVASTRSGSVLEQVCRVLGDRVRLRVSGLGEERWSLSTEEDLPLFLAELPVALPELLNHRDATIAFRRVGRTLRVLKRGESWWIRAETTPSWHPSPASVLVERRGFVDGLVCLVREFLRVASRWSPAHRDDLELVEWYVRSLEQYCGPPEPEGQAEMWTSKKDEWVLEEDEDGLTHFRHQAAMGLLMENEITAAAIRRRMRAAGVRVLRRSRGDGR